MTGLMQKVRLLVVAGIAVLLVLAVADFWEGESSSDLEPPVGNRRHVIIVATWAPPTVAMDMHTMYGEQNLDGPPGQEVIQNVSVGQRIEVSVQRRGSRDRVDWIKIEAIVQSSHGEEYPLKMLCTEPSTVHKVCVGVVT